MRVITAPNYLAGAVYQTCINSVDDHALRDRLAMITPEIITAENEYEQKATSKQFHLIPPNNCANDTIVLGAVTKKELKDVYSVHMVSLSKPARATYDFLMDQAPLGRCPFCGLGHVSTLDHYLPKSKYPQLSVLPLNLVPSCKDCNTGKRAAVAVIASEQSLHPYFDHNNFISEKWLYAEVRQTPLTIRFFVEAPSHWDGISKGRVQSHFNNFNLASRYAIEASDELSVLRNLLIVHGEPLSRNEIKQLLERKAQAHADQHKNSWKTAMFQALAENDWYCNGGFGQ